METSPNFSTNETHTEHYTQSPLLNNTIVSDALPSLILPSRCPQFRLVDISDLLCRWLGLSVAQSHQSNATLSLNIFNNYNDRARPSLTSFPSPPRSTLIHTIQEIKALVTRSEHEVSIAKDALKATERGIEEAYERNRIAKATHDGLVVKLSNLKAQFREQIMEDGLKESNRWNEMYFKLLQWKESHDGDVLVPVDKDSTDDTKKLSRWVINQRSAYKYFMNGDTKHIKDHRIDALNKVSRSWTCDV